MKKALLTLLPLLLAAGPTLAQQRPAPGLWEYSMKMKGDAKMEAGMARMKDELARMPPEQRAQMEAMMAQRGVALGAGGPGQGMAVKVCLSADQAARDELPQADGNCKTTSKERSGNTLRFKFECTGERATKGEGEYTFISSKEHKGRTVVDSMVKGQPQRMEMEQAGKWLAADCGDIKPRK